MSEGFHLKVLLVRAITLFSLLVVVADVMTRWHTTEVEARIAHEKMLESQSVADVQKAMRDKTMYEVMLREEQNKSPEWLRKNCEEKKP